MNSKLTTISHSSTGTKTISCPFIPQFLRITVSEKNNSDTVNHRSVGQYSFDSDFQVVDVTYSDGSGHKTERHSDLIVNQLERVSGTLTAKTVAHVDQATAPWERTTAPYNVKYIVDTADVNYQYEVEILG